MTSTRTARKARTVTSAHPRVRFSYEDRMRLAHAAGTDAGTRSMRAAGRAAWNEDDYNEASRVANALYPEVPRPVSTPTTRNLHAAAVADTPSVAARARASA
jgi:hypothetical protein